MSKHINLIRIAKIAVVVLTAPVFAGCAAGGAISAVASLAGSALEMTGLKKPDNAPTEVKFTLHAGENLNASSGQASALVTKIYYLKNSEAFMRAPLTALLDAEQQKATLGDALVAARDLTLTPGQKYENLEKVPKEASYIAVAGLFFSPAPQRWKYAFKIEDVEDDGIVMGAHACALTFAKGKVTLPAGVPAYDPSRLASVRCPG